MHILLLNRVRVYINKYFCVFGCRLLFVAYSFVAVSHLTSVPRKRHVQRRWNSKSIDIVTLKWVE